MKGNAKRAAWRLGVRAERWAAWILRLKGYRILVHRYKTPVGEIDLIARRGNLLCFVEVKARSKQVEETPVTNRQMMRISRAGQQFVQKSPGLGGLDVRYDVILLSKRLWPEHMADVWRPSH